MKVEGMKIKGMKQGSVLIELLWVLPILFVLLAAVFQIGRLVYVHQKVIIASRIGAERAAMTLNPSATNARGAMFFPYNYNGGITKLALTLFRRRLVYLVGGSRQKPPILPQITDISGWGSWIFPSKNRAEQIVRTYLTYSLATFGIDPSRIQVEYRMIPYIRYLPRNGGGADSIAVLQGGMDRSVGYLHPGEVDDSQVDNLTRLWWEEDQQREKGGDSDPHRITRYELPYGVWLVACKVTVTYPVTPMVKALIGAAGVLLGGIRLDRDEVVISRVTVFPAPLSAIDIVDATQSLRLAQFDTDKGPVPTSLGVINFFKPPTTWLP